MNVPRVEPAQHERSSREESQVCRPWDHALVEVRATAEQAGKACKSTLYHLGDCHGIGEQDTSDRLAHVKRRHGMAWVAMVWRRYLGTPCIFAQDTRHRTISKHNLQFLSQVQHRQNPPATFY